MAASGASKKAVAAAQRYLDRQAWGSRRGRFAVQRTLDHLKSGSVALNGNVKAIKLNIPSASQTNNNGGRRFLYENVPQLKFQNPHVLITRTKDASRGADIQVVFADGSKASISTLQKAPSQIMEEVIKLTSPTRRENMDGSGISAEKEER